MPSWKIPVRHANRVKAATVVIVVHAAHVAMVMAVVVPVVMAAVVVTVVRAVTVAIAAHVAMAAASVHRAQNVRIRMTAQRQNSRQRS